MPTKIEVPSLGESVNEAVLLRWLKNDGDYVIKDEPVVELETDKANADLPATASGVLRRAKEAGETVHVGEAIGRIEEAPAPAEKPAAAAAAPAPKAAAPQPATATAAQTAAQTATPQTPAPAQSPETDAPAARPAAAAAGPRIEDLSPAVRRLVEENKINTAALAGTGPGGRITKDDVLKHLDEEDEAEEPSPGNGKKATPSNAGSPRDQGAQPGLQHAVPTGGILDTTPPAAVQATGPDGFNSAGIKRVPMSKIRRRIAERLVSAQRTAAILTTFNEIDLTALLSLRARYKDRFNEVYGVSLGLMSFFARATVLALREFPRVNAEIEGDDILYHQHVHLGIAVSTDRGLAVPVLRHAEALSFARIESEIKRLALATREGKLGLQELSGGTFTITNGGVFGSLLSTPIVNPPQSGILGMHAIVKRPMAINDKVEIRPMMYVALSYDHRLVDGKESVSFLVRLKEYLEDPARLMLEI